MGVARVLVRKLYTRDADKNRVRVLRKDDTVTFSEVLGDKQNKMVRIGENEFAPFTRRGVNWMKVNK